MRYCHITSGKINIKFYKNVVQKYNPYGIYYIRAKKLKSLVAKCKNLKLEKVKKLKVLIKDLIALKTKI